MRFPCLPGALLLALAGAGCLARVDLHRVVLDYDEAISRVEAEMLLLNVARARHGRPLHFTTVSGVTATFDHGADASIGGELAENPGISILTPSLGVRASESPTLSIVPMQGEEFTRRLLVPLDESTLAFFYHQGGDPVALLRMVAHAFVLDEGPTRRFLPNDPLAPDAEFQRVLDLIGELARRGRLDVGPLVFDETWSLEAAPPPSAGELADLVERGFDVVRREDGDRLARRVIGRHALTSYDPATLTNDERAELARRALQYPAYFVLVDVRDDPGGPALRGWIKLRSLGSILDATARAVASEPDPGAPGPLLVVESREPARDALFSVRYGDLHYSVPVDVEGRNPEAFQVLYRLYQMAVKEIPGASLPTVTIAK